MSTHAVTTELLTLIADRFRALGEPARLRILDALRDGERTVTELSELTGFGQANLSKHLQLLYTVGLVCRRKEGVFVHYAIADDSVYRLCDQLCDQLCAEVDARGRVLTGGAEGRRR